MIFTLKVETIIALFRLRKVLDLIIPTNVIMNSGNPIQWLTTQVMFVYTPMKSREPN